MRTRMPKKRSGKVEAKAAEGERQVMALWVSVNDWIRHGDVIRRVPEVKTRTIERILRRLTKEHVLEQWKKGSATFYRKLEAPKEFKAVAYLSELDSRLSNGMAYEFDVGGGISHIAFGRLLGFPDLKEGEL